MNFTYTNTPKNDEKFYVLTALNHIFYSSGEPQREFICLYDLGYTVDYGFTSNLSQACVFKTPNEMLRELEDIRVSKYFNNVYKPSDFMYKVVTMSEDMKIEEI